VPGGGDSAPRIASHGAGTQTGHGPGWGAGAWGAGGTPSPEGSQPKAEPTLPGTLRAPGPPPPSR